MEKSVEVQHLGASDLDYILSLIKVNGKKLPLDCKISYAQKILADRDLPSLIMQSKFDIRKEVTGIQYSLTDTASLIAAFRGTKADPLYKKITNKLTLLDQRVEYFKVPQESENSMLKYSYFKHDSLAKNFQLKTELNKKILVDGIPDKNGNKPLHLKEKRHGFASMFKDNFKFIQKLGKGAYGQVTEVEHKYDKCHYAVKRVSLPTNMRYRYQAFREGQALAKLQHKNIVRYYNCWVERPLVDIEEETDKDVMKLSLSNMTSESTSTVTSASSAEDVKSTCKSIRAALQKQKIAQRSPGKEKPAATIQKTSTIMKEEKSEGKENLQVIKKNRGQRRFSRDLGRKNISFKRSRKPKIFLYVQMELCKGGNLETWLKENKDRKYDEILDIFLQILDAVKYLHSMKLIHRDLKPANIFLSAQKDIIKVGDLGLAVDIRSLNVTRGKKTASHRALSIVGTTLYMSPEQSTAGTYDFKVDVYALGIIFFELLVYFSTKMERFKVLTELREQNIYPDGFVEKYPVEYILIQNMLQKNPNKRFGASKALEFLKIYENILLYRRERGFRNA